MDPIFPRLVPSLIQGLMNPAGGLGYHLRALRYQSKLWEPFRSVITEDLMRWRSQVQSSKAVLVGPSAGYCVKDIFFKSFQEIEILEPDPIARLLFQKKNPHSASANAKTSQLLDASLVSYQHPVPIVFCNVLGQLGLFKRDSFAPPVAPGLLSALFKSHRPFFSFHDRISFKINSKIAVPVRLTGQTAFLSTPKLIEHCETMIESSLMGGEKTSLVYDHETAVQSNHLRSYYAWRITPKQMQIIESFSESRLSG